MPYKFFFPFLLWRKRVNKETLRADVIAGIIGAIIVFPQGIAFATIAGLPPQYGLYAAIVPAIIAAFWGSSWHLVSGPTTAISLVVYASLFPLETPGSAEYIGLAITLAFMVGVLQFILGTFRFGTFVQLISPTVIVGFTAGAGVLIASTQLKNGLGLAIPSGSSFYHTWEYVLSHLSSINVYVLFITLITLLVGVVFRAKFKKIPYMIPAIVVGSLIAWALNTILGVNITGITTIGALPVSLPPLSMPNFDSSILRELATAALAITLLGLTEAVAIARSVAIRSKQHINGNQEFVGQGLSNIVGSFFSAYPSSGSFNRSGLNYEAGAKTPLASVFAALALIILILILSPLAAYMPYSVMAAILFIVAYGIIDTQHIKEILHSGRSETTVLVITFLSTLLIELEFAIFIGVFLSLALFLRRVMFAEVVEVAESPAHNSLCAITEESGASRTRGVLMVRIDMSLMYMNCEGIFEKIQELVTVREYLDGKPLRLVVLSFSGVNYIDIAGLNAYKNFIKDMDEEGVTVCLLNVKNNIIKALTKHGLRDVAVNYQNFETLRNELLIGKSK